MATQNNPQSALETWQERLEYLQRELAIASDHAQKFELQKQIEECHQKIKELEQNQTNGNPPSNLPYSGTPHFVGREDTLKELHEQLGQDNRLAICAVSGMGGIGKTELAIQYALKHQEDYPGGLCWLQCRGADLETQIVNYGSLLSLAIPEELELADRVVYCWNHWREGTALVIYDDVADYHAIAPFLPPGNKAQFKVLMTSRQRAGANYKRIDLDILDEDSALKLLRSLIGEKRIDAELEQAKQLCKWLGYLPLGLELVGRYLELDPLLKIEKVQERLNSKKLDAKVLIHQKQADMTAKLGVAAAFELSWEQLSEKARTLGCRLSLFAAAPIDWALVEECYPTHEIWDIPEIREMRENPTREEEYKEFLFLVQNYLNETTAQIHSLQQVEKEIERWIEQWQEEREEIEEIRNLELIGRNLLQITKDREYSLHPLIREFFSAKQGDIENIDEYKKDLRRVMVAVAKQIPQTVTLNVLASVTPVIPHLKELAEKLIDWVEDEDLFWLNEGLGRVYKGQSAYIEAEKWYRQSVKVILSRLGENHPDVATSYNNLAFLYELMGRYTEAEPMYRQSLEIRLEQLGENHPDVATSYNNLAFLYQLMGRYTEAEPMYRQSLEIGLEQLGENHPHVASSYNNLAFLYQLMGKYGEAEPMYRQSLEIWIEQLGENHPNIATSYNNLAGLYQLMGRYGEAEPMYQKSLEIRLEQLGENHPDVATSYNNLALLYESMGRYGEAEPMYRKSLEIILEQLGKNHPHVASSYNNLANLYESMGKYGEAEPMYRQSLEIRLEQLGENHPHVASSYNNLANLYKAMGRYEDAIAYYQQALNIARQTLGEDHPNTGTIQNNYIRMLMESPEAEILKALPEENHKAYQQMRQDWASRKVQEDESK